jgi:hypothetical protein
MLVEAVGALASAVQAAGLVQGLETDRNRKTLREPSFLFFFMFLVSFGMTY